jgi:hypothetical protein
MNTDNFIEMEIDYIPLEFEDRDGEIVIARASLLGVSISSKDYKSLKKTIKAKTRIPRTLQLHTKLYQSNSIVTKDHNYSSPDSCVGRAIELIRTKNHLEATIEFSDDFIQDILLKKAYSFAKDKHAGMVDDTGADYFEAHICQVVELLEVVTKDKRILASAYLHDTVEDCGVTKEELIEEFDEYIANLVMEVTHEGQKDSYGYYFPRLKSREAIMIKLADRTSNISRMESWDEKRQQQYLRKTKFWNDAPPEVIEKKVKG